MRHEVEVQEDGSRWIGEDRAWPIYSVVLVVSYRERSDPLAPWEEKEETTSWHVMKREEVTEDDLHQEAEKALSRIVETWNQGRDERGAPRMEDARVVSTEVKGLRWETWCLDWFSHWTWDTGQTDRQALASFTRYVNRYRHMQDHFSPEVYGEDYICLMGAEDRWRWKGRDGDGTEGSGETRPPCRCGSCRELGIIRVDH